MTALGKVFVARTGGYHGPSREKAYPAACGEIPRAKNSIEFFGADREALPQAFSGYSGFRAGPIIQTFTKTAKNAGVERSFSTVRP
jgi:hypothetical protein